MVIKSKTNKGKGKIQVYGLWLPDDSHPAQIEMDLIRAGGYLTVDGIKAGNGLSFHFRRFQELIWEKAKRWHDWNVMEMEAYLEHRTIIEIGPASSGKTNSAATNVLADYYCFPKSTTAIICSTTRERLEDRVWGEIKKYHRIAKRAVQWLKGSLIEGRQRLVTDGRDESSEGRDFRNGVIGVACQLDTEQGGLSSFIGIKNERLRLVADELHLLPKVIIDAISNLDKNPDFKLVGLGNPKDIMDALGVLAEPAPELGGWDSGIDQTPKTKSWKIRRPNGICIQLCGTDSPNIDGKLGIPLITREAIDRDIEFYGEQSLQYTMMDLGMMPRGQGTRRVITRIMCEQFGAKEPPLWYNDRITRIGCLDAAYGGVGGDRCIFGVLEFGKEALVQDPAINAISAIINQNEPLPKQKTIISLAKLVRVPLNVAGSKSKMREAEDQIVAFVRNECTMMNIEPENFFYDSGMRTGLVSAFHREWSVATNPIDCGGSPTDRRVSEGINKLCKDYYSKLITEFWFSVRLAIEAGQFRNLTDEVINEGASREWKIVGNNKIEIETKAEMKAKTGRSPDLFDCLCIGVEGARQRGFQIESQAKPKKLNPFRQPNWRDEMQEKSSTFWHGKALDYRA